MCRFVKFIIKHKVLNFLAATCPDSASYSLSLQHSNMAQNKPRRCNIEKKKRW